MGNLPKLFTPEAKNRYATIGSIKSTTKTKIFFIGVKLCKNKKDG